MYDLIGDIHGHAEALKELLFRMGYKEKPGGWQHKVRKAVFVGDYIDRGPSIRETLSIVRNMQESGNAIALLGNHEYNALAYDYVLPDSTHLRKHNPVHYNQHSQTLLQFGEHQGEWKDHLKWFYTLPIYLELPELRAVHACWDHEHIQWLRENGYETVTEELLVSSHQNGYPKKVIDEVLKGKEFNLPEGLAYYDKDGHQRTASRYRWWLNTQEANFSQFLFNCPPQLQQQMITEEISTVSYASDEKPVFFGHYWLEDPFPMIQSGNVVCLDYSIAKGGSLVAYRWNGERTLKNSRFVSVPYKS